MECPRSFRFLTPFFDHSFRLLRNSPRPWVKHAPSPATPDSLKDWPQKAKSSMSLLPLPQTYPTIIQRIQ